MIRRPRTRGARKVTVYGLTAIANSATLIQLMSRWNVKAWVLFVLGSVVFLMLVIVVLPDVDLPDTAFHGGTAPSVVHAKATSAPDLVIVASVPQIHSAAGCALAWERFSEFRLTRQPNFRPILLRSIRC